MAFGFAGGIDRNSMEGPGRIHRDHHHHRTHRGKPWYWYFNDATASGSLFSAALDRQRARKQVLTFAKSI